MRGDKEHVQVIRRSVALPGNLVAEALTSAPPGLKSNFNRLVIVALEEFVERHRQQAFADSMAQMAADPAIRRQSDSIASEFRLAESDGLVSKKKR